MLGCSYFLALRAINLRIYFVLFLNVGVVQYNSVAVSLFFSCTCTICCILVNWSNVVTDRLLMLDSVIRYIFAQCKLASITRLFFES
jgi:hypothetical protein